MKTEPRQALKKAPRKRERDRHQLNVEVEEKLKSEAQLCAMLEHKTTREWCVSVIRQAVESTLKQRGVQSPFDSHHSHSGCALVGVPA